MVSTSYLVLSILLVLIQSIWAQNLTQLSTLPECASKIFAFCKVPIRNLGPTINGIAAGLGSAAFVFILTRLATRLHYSEGGLGWDDIAIILPLQFVPSAYSLVYLLSSFNVHLFVSPGNFGVETDQENV
ncbi:uncharacterized protein PV09_06918 [Verruconis gallopava]|uniref:Uncharacterized protein n=1 Tax=Verruconis gallopava TaxID=253628 RepID=A0A0D1YLM3_9PEZI|nr:uncharacterized protein PV09_06918 [Verruconis gallopava]KIW01742.1 hypothetical protein PV09_06918 [Verruconis gallopava]